MIIIELFDICLKQLFISFKTREPAIYHNDLKLENILVSISNGRLKATKIADFGISQVSGVRNSNAQANKELAVEKSFTPAQKDMKNFARCLKYILNHSHVSIPLILVPQFSFQILHLMTTL